MTYNPDQHHRRSIRLKGYDYSQTEWYFVTICIKNREMLFGKIIKSEMFLNEYGKIVEYTWFDLPNHNGHIELDEFVIMPNHVHGIIEIKNGNIGNNNSINEGKKVVMAGSEPAITNERKHRLLSEIVRQFKTFFARIINEKRNIKGIPVWHRNYYEHIIRNEDELNKIRYYIKYNPANWKDDDLYI